MPGRGGDDAPQGPSAVHLGFTRGAWLRLSALYLALGLLFGLGWDTAAEPVHAPDARCSRATPAVGRLPSRIARESGLRTGVPTTV